MDLLNPYCSVEQLQSYMKTAFTAEAVVDQLELAINAASRWIDDYRSRTFYEHDHSEEPLIVRAHSRDIANEWLFLPGPIIELDAVEVCGEAWTEEEHYLREDAAGKLMSQQGYWIGPIDFSEIGNVHPWLRAFRNTPAAKIEITGRFGYSQYSSGEEPALDRTLVPTGLPTNIHQAALQIAAAFTRLNNRDVQGLDGQKVGITEVDIPKSALMLLGPRVSRL
jgi:hypothetical protein